ncbi:MAG: DUF4825 domain-containing protein [Oscillospiraceae bacterium]|nr:DUF4825 domain-containing protein [Oscillospiraceae bacterium]
MEKLPCEIVQDLLPSYVDGLTNPGTGEAVREHLEDCEACRGIYERMTRLPDSAVDPAEKTELDFLKKKHRQTLRVTVGSLLGALLLLIAGLFVGFFVVGRELLPETLAYTLEQRDGALLLHGYSLSSGTAITGVTREREGGVLTLHCKGTLVGVYRSGEFSEQIPLDPELREIRVGTRVVWADGRGIQQEISRLYNTRHAYVGDMPANMKTAEALELAQRFGSFTSQLQTEAQPYEWTLTFSEPIPATALERVKSSLRTDACLMMASIDNLDAVSFALSSEGKPIQIHVSREEGDQLAGRPLRECGANPALLQSLRDRLGKAVYDPGVADLPEDDVLLTLVIINDTDLDLRNLGIHVCVDGAVLFSRGVCNADGSLIQHGETLSFDLERQDLNGRDNETKFSFALSLEDAAGNQTELPPQTLNLSTHSQVFFLRQEDAGFVLVPMR